MSERLRRAGVTEREAEVLSAVAERLRNREIAERFHVSVRTVESHIAALLRKLGVPDRAALAELGTQLRRVSGSDTSLPVPLTSLVGRESEAGDVAGLVERHRLVTLIGPGGVGKTRLGLRVAGDLAGRFPDGARLADLGPVGPELVADTVARALGVVPQPGWSLPEVLRDAAGGMSCLLLVDNCEHVVGEVAEIVADLLSTGTDLRVLATSREPLGVPGEATYPLQGLSVPAAGEAVWGASAAGFDAVRLFVDRARTALPGFVLTDGNAGAVAAVCRRLDGLPLAIELAASRVRSFEPALLVTHLDHRFDLLTAGVRTGPRRHRTLRAVIDWSYDLLDDAERGLLDRLGVFPADFDFPAVRAVCDPHDSGGASVISLLASLVDKSLVTVIGPGTYRYRLLENVRVYAAERLAAGTAEAATRRRHAAYYLGLAEQGGEQLRTGNQRAWLARLTAERPNLRGGLEYAIGSGDVESAWRWVAALRRFWDLTGQRREAGEWIHRVLTLGEPPASPVGVLGLVEASATLQPSDVQTAFDLALRAAHLAASLDGLSQARAARAVGMGAFWLRPELVLPTLHEALAGFGDDHPWERALTMQSLTQATGDLAEALTWGRRSVVLFRQVGDQMYAANTLFIMAQRCLYAGIGDDEVHRLLIESQALAEAAGSEEDKAHALVGLGQLAWLRGDHEGGARMMLDCLPRLRRLGDQRCTGRALYVLGQWEYERGNLRRALELLDGSIHAITLAGQSFVLVNALELLAAVHHAQGRYREAAMLLGTADTTRELASPHMRPIRPPDEELRRSLIQVLGATAFDTAYGHFKDMSVMQALRHPELSASDPAP